jgi:hypothetical protein
LEKCKENFLDSQIKLKVTYKNIQSLKIDWPEEMKD